MGDSPKEDDDKMLKNETYSSAVQRMMKYIDEDKIILTNQWDNVNDRPDKELRIIHLDALSVMHELLKEYPASRGWNHTLALPDVSGTPIRFQAWG